ncbi:TIGR01777 family oxidoreductase [Bacteroidota bacterium]
MTKKILIAGAGGLIGKALLHHFNSSDFEITVLTRELRNSENSFNKSINFVKWDCGNHEGWAGALEGQNIVINLAGANLVAKRWDSNFKKLIYNSRINCTKQLVNAIGKCNKKPDTLITASAVGIYGNRGNEILTESGKPGNDFLSTVCSDWESEAKKVQVYNTRFIALRIGLVLSQDGGVLKNSLLPFRLFIGGKLGNGKQFFPWIHIDDLVGIIHYVIENPEIDGSVNCASPGIVREAEFARTLGKVLKRPAIIPVPRSLLRIVLGEIADSILSSQNISVEKLIKAGYEFKYADLLSALKQILGK